MLARCFKRVKDVIKYYPLPQIEKSFHATLLLAKQYEAAGHFGPAIQEFSKADILLETHYTKISKDHPGYTLQKERLHLTLLIQWHHFFGTVTSFHESKPYPSRQYQISLDDYYKCSVDLKDTLLTARKNQIAPEAYLKSSLLVVLAALYKLEYTFSHANKNTFNRNRFKALQLEIANEVTPLAALIEFYENQLLPLAKGKPNFEAYIQKKIIALRTPPVAPTPVVVKIKKASVDVASSSLKLPVMIEEKKAPVITVEPLTPVTAEPSFAPFFASVHAEKSSTIKYKKPYSKKKKESKEVAVLDAAPASSLPVKKTPSRRAINLPVFKMPQETPLSAFQEEKAKKAELFTQQLLIKQREAKANQKKAALELKEKNLLPTPLKRKKPEKLKPLAAITILNRQGDETKVEDFQNKFIAPVSTHTPARVIIKGGYIPLIKLSSELKPLDPRYYPQDFDLAIHSNSEEMAKKIDAIALSAGLKTKEEKSAARKPYLNFSYPLGTAFNCEITRTVPGYKSVDYVTPLNLFLRINKHGFIFQMRPDLITHITEEKLKHIEKLYADKMFEVEPYQPGFRSYVQRCHKYYRIFTKGYGFNCAPEILNRLFNPDALAPCFKNLLTGMNELKKYLEWIKDLYSKYADETLELDRMSQPVLQAFIRGWYANQDRGLSSTRIKENLDVLTHPDFINKFRIKLFSSTDEDIKTILQNLFLDTTHFPLFAKNSSHFFSPASPTSTTQAYLPSVTP